jgi:hypothetical protein
VARLKSSGAFTPIQLGSMFAAVSIVPSLTTEGRVSPTGPGMPIIAVVPL